MAFAEAKCKKEELLAASWPDTAVRE